VLASCSLFGLYLLLKYFPDLSLQTLLDGYFFLLGTAAITGAARPLLRKVLGPLGKPNMCFDVPDGLLLDDQGDVIKQVRGHPTAWCCVWLVELYSSSLRQAT
jgi:minor histocompatibility antigen H13